MEDDEYKPGEGDAATYEPVEPAEYVKVMSCLFLPFSVAKGTCVGKRALQGGDPLAAHIAMGTDTDTQTHR